MKDTLIRFLEYPLRYPSLFRRFKLAAGSGVLLYGPPGCGKTLLAEAISAECKANFIRIKGPELLASTFGQSEENVRSLFAKARQSSPCVLFFDELDALGRIRSNQSGGQLNAGGAADRILAALIAEIDHATRDSSQSSSSIFVLGATNRPDMVDPALLRPGNFYSKKMLLSLVDLSACLLSSVIVVRGANSSQAQKSLPRTRRTIQQNGVYWSAKSKG